MVDWVAKSFISIASARENQQSFIHWRGRVFNGLLNRELGKLLIRALGVNHVFGR